MKSFILFFGLVGIAHSRVHLKTNHRCVNLWDEGCINGQLDGAGNDDNYLNGGFNPGKRCVNLWDEGCINGQLDGAGNDDNYLNGGFNPGKRCVNLWDEGCINGQLDGAGNDDNYLNGGFNPGKRCVNLWDEGCINGQLDGAVLVEKPTGEDSALIAVKDSANEEATDHVNDVYIISIDTAHVTTMETIDSYILKCER